MPTFYECSRCTACCRWPGEVRVSDAEVDAIADFLGLTATEFAGNFTRLNHLRTGLTLMERADGACVFLDGQNCRIQTVKPQQCRDFPNLWNFPGFTNLCQARAVELNQVDWNNQVSLSTGRNPNSIGFTVT